MNFAGQKYTYISKKKVEKLNNIRSQKQKDDMEIDSFENINDLKKGNQTIHENDKEEGDYDESIKDIMMIDGESNNLNVVPNMISLEAPKNKYSSRQNAFKESRKRSRSRSRSNSLEKNDDEELDNVYSCGEEEDEDIKVNPQPQLPSSTLTFKYDPKKSEKFSNLNQPEKSSGLFSKIGNSFKNIFSSNKKQEAEKGIPDHKKLKTEVLYSVSQLNRNLNNNQKRTYEHEVDTNILSLKFEFLKDKVEYATGDPVLCKCDGVFNLYSNITKIEGSHKSLWICEFCGEKNEIVIEKEEIPTTDCVDFFVQSANQLNKGMKGLNYNDEQSLVFCFDVSGSMCVTSPITGKYNVKGNYFEKMKAELMSFSDGSDQFYGGGNRNVTYVSRLQCLQAAIESNLSQMLKEAPNRKVGFVTFNNEVIAYGDGTKTPVKINGNNLNEFETIKSIADENKNIISIPLKESHGFLLKQLYSIEETGQTSLGPAVLFSINMIDGVSPGSRIILCTDGISNMGVGCMEGKTSQEELDTLRSFYKNLGLLAKTKGVIVDLITFEDEQSNIDILMHMIEETGGEIIRVKPTEILNQFSNLLTNEIVATNVKVKVKLHKLMQFRNEDVAKLKHFGSTLTRELGNVTRETEMYVEYSFKKSEEIAKYDNVDLENLKYVPFQSIIDYTNLAGDRCIRVVTKQQQICTEKDIVQKQANFDIISTNAIQKTSKLAKDGNLREAQSNALAWKKFMKTQVEENESANRNYKIYSNNMNDFNNNMQEVQYNQLNDLNDLNQKKESKKYL
jgi:hypothetical protein